MIEQQAKLLMFGGKFFMVKNWEILSKIGRSKFALHNEWIAYNCLKKGFLHLYPTKEQLVQNWPYWNTCIFDYFDFIEISRKSINVELTKCASNNKKYGD